MATVECPYCKAVIEYNPKKEKSLGCSRCDHTFPSQEALGISGIRDKAIAMLRKRSKNPQPLRKQSKMEELWAEALDEVKLRIHTRGIMLSDLGREKEGMKTFDIALGESFEARATLWKGLLYDVQRFDAQLNIQLVLSTGHYVKIYLHQKDEPLYEGWKPEERSDMISGWDQMMLDGDLIVG